MADLMDALPLWALFALTVTLVFVTVELGYDLGAWRARRSARETESAATPLGSATLTLLGFVLAFTFSFASLRYEDRRQVVLEESNAIGTAFLRTDFLPAGAREESRGLYIRYVDARINAAVTLDARTAIVESERIQGELWRLGADALNTQPGSEAVARYVEALNAVIDVHAKRVQAGVRSRVPPIIWLGLYLLTVFAMFAVGYPVGLAGTSRTPAVLPLALAFALVLCMIAVLERPGRGVVGVDQYPMEALRRSMEPAAPATPAPSAQPPG